MYLCADINHANFISIGKQMHFVRTPIYTLLLGISTGHDLFKEKWGEADEQSRKGLI
jgi:hypothetical protein